MAREQLRGETLDRSRSSPGGHKVFTSGSRASAVLVEEIPESAGEALRFRPEWQLAHRVAASKRLSKSDLLPKFLLYVCERQLLGDVHEITEQRIGTQIFNRATDYNPSEDNIVRSYARLLRKRLDEYFETEGRREPMRIVIPRGGYVPVFQPRADVLAPVPDTRKQTPAEEAVMSVSSAENVVAREASIELKGAVSETHVKPAWSMVLSGLVLGVLLASAAAFGFHRTQLEKAQGPAHAIWMQLFQQNRNTLIVPADSGLGILQNLTGHLATLESYANGSYLSEMKPHPGLGLENLNDLRRQRYTSVVDLNIAAMLTQLPEMAANRPRIRYARSITMEDLNHSNVILLGSTHTNPWVSLFEKDLNFQLEYMPEVDQSFIRNRHPTSTEQTKYLNGTTETVNHTYGAIDYLPSLDGIGHVLIIQGLNMAATQAAAEILFNSAEMKPVLEQALLPNDSLKSFELLVETSSIDATAPGAHVIAARFYP